MCVYVCAVRCMVHTFEYTPVKLWKTYFGQIPQTCSV